MNGARDMDLNMLEKTDDSTLLRVKAGVTAGQKEKERGESFLGVGSRACSCKLKKKKERKERIKEKRDTQSRTLQVRGKYVSVVFTRTLARGRRLMTIGVGGEK